MTPKQSRFLSEYMVDCNGTAAAIRAGYSPRSARQTAAELLARPDIAQEMRRRSAALNARAEVTAEMVLRGLLAEAERTGEGSSHSARVAAWAKLAELTRVFEREASENTPKLEIIVRRLDRGNAGEEVGWDEVDEA